MTKNVLILGSSGRFGRNAAIAFENAGWNVEKFDRSRGDLMKSAFGKDVIVNAWNPPYTDWATKVPKLTAQVIDAAKASGATVLIPGNVYVFGENAVEKLGHNTPHDATNPLGHIRIEMERAYKDAGVKTIILRAGDFLDTEASGNWFDRIIATKVAKGGLSYPGALDRKHAWAFLPDVARAAVELAGKRDQLSDFEDVPFPGYTLTGQELSQLVSQVHPVKIGRMSWLPLKLVSPFWPMGRKLIEMRYLWDKAHYLDGTRFHDLLPEFKETPNADGIRAALKPLMEPT